MHLPRDDAGSLRFLARHSQTFLYSVAVGLGPTFPSKRFYPRDIILSGASD
jgi:hypothetical protein